MDSPVDEFLEHYGVKGMKWGKRKARPTVDLIDDKTGKKTSVPYNPKKVSVEANPDGSVTARASSKRAADKFGKDAKNAITSEDHDRSRELLKKTARSLSNKEMQELNTRLQLERSYNDLTTSKTSTVSAGNKKAKEVLALAGTLQQVYNLANSPLGKTVRLAIGI